MPDFDPALLATYAVAALGLSLTPGPDMLFCFANGVAHGPRGALAAAFGIFLGLAVHLAALTLGLAGLVAASPLAFEALRWAGAAYLVWMAVQAFRSPPMALTADGCDVGPRQVPLAAIVRRGFVTCLLNPKLILFFLSFLPQFIRPEAGSVAVQTLILALILVLPGLAINAAVGVGGGGIGRWLSRHPGFARAQNWFVGGIFLALAARLALVQRG
ncbi:LysE family translocator [Indioceanicola profundi]|uniref:LysE family translocator n=1 Tax=Indioceanicola profundi TaxID=2220096 RepID=UPI000E6A94FF|nr:LysE family translocator [Indioceanicola profundi]